MQASSTIPGVETLSADLAAPANSSILSQGEKQNQKLEDCSLSYACLSRLIIGRWLLLFLTKSTSFELQIYMTALSGAYC